MADFVRADIGKLESFVTESEEAINEFSAIRDEFDRINNTLIANWDGSGKAAFKKVAENITEKVRGIHEILTTINDTVVKDLIAQYQAVDSALAEYNRTAGEPEEGTGNG